MPKIDYTMDAKGKVTRTDKDGVIHVADYNAKTKTLAFVSEETLRFRPPTVNYLNAQEPPVEIDHIILRDVGADDVDAASRDYQARGYVEAYRAAVPTGGEVVYLDNGNGAAEGFIELLPATPGMDATFTRFWEASRTWDGSDPIRPFM